MINVEDVADTNIVEITMDGEISSTDVNRATELLSAKLVQYGSARMLQRVRSLPLRAPLSLWRELKLAKYTLGNFSHVAIVSDAPMVGALGRLCRPLAASKVRWFPEAKLEQARDWLELAKDGGEGGRAAGDAPATVEELRHTAWIP